MAEKSDSDVTITGNAYKRFLHYEDEAKQHWKDGRKGEAIFSLAKGSTPFVQPVLGGAAIYYIATGKWFDNIQVFKDHWWLKPLVILGLGWWLLKKASPWAQAVLAGGAAMFVQAWKARPSSDSSDSSGPGEAGAPLYDWSQGAAPAGALPYGALRPTAGERIAANVFRT